MIRAALSPSNGAPAGEITWEEAKAHLHAANSTVWVDAARVTPEELADLERTFKLHSLVVEDLLHRNQRAKVEQYADYIFVVMHWFSDDGVKPPCELHAVLGKRFLLTVSDAEVDHIVPIDAAWARFRKGSVRGPYGADGMLYRVLDELVDTHVPRVNALEEDIEAINDEVAEGRETPEVIERLVTLRRRLVQMRRMLAPERDALGALSRRDYDLIDEKTALYFRDIHDHLNRTYEAIETLRELDEMVMDVQLALAESRRSNTIKRLTIVSTIFLPISFLASFFGMNFTTIPFDSPRLMYLCFGLMLGVPVLALGWLYARRWI